MDPEIGPDIDADIGILLFAAVEPSSVVPDEFRRAPGDLAQVLGDGHFDRGVHGGG